MDGNTARENVSLSEYTTLRVGGPARYFFVAQMFDDVLRAVDFASETGSVVHILGGGSNILFSDSGFSGVVIKNEVKGIVYNRDKDNTIVYANGGESWDVLVADTVSRGLWGLENLSGIPGTIGAAPIQNIGAYGAEVRDAIVFVDVYDLEKKQLRRFTNTECNFGYRDSIFKKQEAKHFFIKNIALRLSEKRIPNISYADMEQYFMGNIPESSLEIRNAVLAIRAKKIPDPTYVPNAGSFFKNPVIARDIAADIVKKYPDIKQYPMGERVKISAAWLIDRVGHWKGVSEGGVSVCDTQPLVITHTGATARAIDTFARAITEDIFTKTGIMLEREVRTVGDFS